MQATTCNMYMYHTLNTRQLHRALGRAVSELLPREDVRLGLSTPPHLDALGVRVFR